MKTLPPRTSKIIKLCAIILVAMLAIVLAFRILFHWLENAPAPRIPLQGSSDAQPSSGNTGTDTISEVEAADMIGALTDVQNLSAEIAKENPKDGASFHIALDSTNNGVYNFRVYEGYPDHEVTLKRYAVSTEDRTIVDVLAQENHAANDPWTGMWVRRGSTDGADSADLEISNLTAGNFQFSIEAFSGGATAVIGAQQLGPNESGSLPKAVIGSDGSASYDDTSDDPSNDEACLLNFSLLSNSQMNVTEQKCDGYEGEGTMLSGTYVRDGVIAPQTMQTADIFLSHPDAYPIFEKLAGEHATDFDATVGVESGVSSDLETNADEEDFSIEHLGAQSIIEVGPGNKIWAAFVDFDADGNGNDQIDYFTNVPLWKDKLPQKIAEWAPTGDAVMYMSK